MSRERRGRPTTCEIREADALVSVLAPEPGPTDTPFDVVAAVVAALAPRGPIAMLGFAAGGIVAPLRALGRTGPIAGVDRDTRHVDLFRRVAARWAGPVTVTKDDALAWCARVPAGRFAAVIEDLSVVRDGSIVKPRVSLVGLPDRLPRLALPRGIVVVNLLPIPGWSWRRIVRAALGPRPEGLLFECVEWENRVLATGSDLPAARGAGRRVRAALAGLRSSLAGGIRVRRVAPA